MTEDCSASESVLELKTFFSALFPSWQESDTFAGFYQHVGYKHNGTHLRLSYYPGISDQTSVAPSQTRCGAHTDSGGISLLIQDGAGGLEVSRDTAEIRFLHFRLASNLSQRLLHITTDASSLFVARYRVR